MPAGVDVTVPLPSPARDTVRVRDAEVDVKVAVTDWAALMVTEQAPVPVQAPLHPAKVEPAVAAWLRVTTVPEL